MNNGSANGGFPCNDPLDLRDKSKTQTNTFHGECGEQKRTSRIKASSFMTSVSEIVNTMKEKFRIFPFLNNQNGFDHDNFDMASNQYCNVNHEQWRRLETPADLPVYNGVDLCAKDNYEGSMVDTSEQWAGSLKETHQFHRFYHVFREEELLMLIKRAPDLKVVYHSYDHGNWTVIAEKHPI